MITSTDCKRIILEENPSFVDQWQDYIDEWGGDLDGLGFCMSEFSSYTSDLISTRQVKRLPDIFAMIERFLVDGDQEVKDAAATQFLENVQNRVGGEEHTAALFVPLLGPESRDYCIAWDAFTGVQTPGLLASIE